MKRRRRPTRPRRPSRSRRVKTFGDIEDTLKVERPSWMPDNFEETCKPRGLGALLDEPPRFEDMLDGMSLSGSPAKTTKSNDPTRSVKAKSGMKPLSIWSDAVEPYLNQETKPGKKKFPSIGNAATAIASHLTNSGKNCPHDRTIKKWLRAHPHLRRWVRGGAE